jgi:hypothetical protein
MPGRSRLGAERQLASITPAYSLRADECVCPYVFVIAAAGFPFPRQTYKKVP